MDTDPLLSQALLKGKRKKQIVVSKGKDKSGLTQNKAKEKQLASDSSLNTLDVAYEQDFTQDILGQVITCKTKEQAMRFLKRILHLSKPDLASIVSVLLEDKAAFDAKKQSMDMDHPVGVKNSYTSKVDIKGKGKIDSNEEHSYDSSLNTLDMPYEKRFTQEIIAHVTGCNTEADGIKFLQRISNLGGPDVAMILQVLLEDNREADLEATRHSMDMDPHMGVMNSDAQVHLKEDADPRDKGKGLAEFGSSLDKKDGSSSSSAGPKRSDLKKMERVGKVISLLPPTTADQVSNLSPEDQETLAYLISKVECTTRNDTHRPSYFCRCFLCYSFYYHRLELSTSSTTMDDIMEVVLDEEEEEEEIWLK